MKDIKLQAASLDIWETKYQLKDQNGVPVDKNINDTYKRIARTLADLETKDKDKAYDDFLWALQNGATPAGRIMSNTGAKEYKPSTSTINCTVSDTINDSMISILDKQVDAGLTLKAGCGIGYEFSTLRPSGAHVTGAGSTTSGPLSFMDVYDKLCLTISSAGGRRGAQMATFDIHHPDVMNFIKAKREDGRFRQFNCSLLITDKFVNAVKNDGDWKLSFPVTQKEVESEKLNLKDSETFLWREFPTTENYVVSEDGLVACRIYSTIKAKELWDSVMKSTYDYAEPGFILIDKVNEMNNNWFCENIRATNPCGEQPLPPFGACLLGSINLTKFITKPFTEKASFDFKKYKKVVAVFTRMLDNVVEINGLPLPQQQAEITRKRRHGMGILGLGSTVTMMGMRYGSEKSIAFTEKVNKEMALTGWIEGVKLAKEKGPAPIMNELFEITNHMVYQRPELLEDGLKVGDKVSGKTLLLKYSKYMKKITDELGEKFISEFLTHGSRFTHHTSIAPTGTIALSVANNSSNGIEPSFGHHYARNIIKEGRSTKQKVDVFSFELLAYRHLVDSKAMPYDSENPLPEYFIGADDVTPEEHVNVQAAAQKWVDSAISKTANVPTDFDFEKFKDIYMQAYDAGLKGCTTFRFNPEAFQGVLVKEEDLKNTKYKFTLEGGDEIIVAGNEMIEYEGELHSAANLFDGIKEGTYGKL